MSVERYRAEMKTLDVWPSNSLVASTDQGPVAVLAAPHPHGFHRPSQSLPLRVALHHPVTSARSRPVVGESEKIECAVPTSDLLTGGRFPERE